MIKMEATLERLHKTEKQTLGILTLFKGGKEVFRCHTLELPWKDNKRQISCIPEGEYKVIPRESPKFKKHFHVLDVPGREYILIHPGNYYTQIRGCILPGDGLMDINNDEEQDVLNSRKTLNKLLELAPDGFKLCIY